MDPNTANFNLSVVLRETGIKADTLRAWERRYGLPQPERTEGGHRLYSQRDIEIVRWLMAREEEGLRISQAVEMFTQEVSHGNDPLIAAAATPERTLPSAPDDLIVELTDDVRDPIPVYLGQLLPQVDALHACSRFNSRAMSWLSCSAA